MIHCLDDVLEKKSEYDVNNNIFQSELRTVSVDPVAGHCYMENLEPGHRYGMVTVVNETMGGLAEDWMCIYVEDGGDAHFVIIH